MPVRSALRVLIDAWHVPAVGHGLLGGSLIGLGSLTPAMLPNRHPFEIDFLDHWIWHGVGTLVLLIGVALLIDAWLRLRPLPALPARGWAVMAWWSIPFLVVPPVFSNDAYSYAAQGRMVLDRVDPYVFGPSAGAQDFLQAVDADWRDTPAPYGPLALQLNRLIVSLAGNDPWWSAVGMRLPALVSVLVLAWLIPRIAVNLGVDPDRAVWWGLMNPLVPLHLIGGAHNDAMMLAGMAGAVFVATRGHLVAGSVLIALAAGIKQTAFFGLVAVVAISLLVKHPPPERAEDGPIAARAAPQTLATRIPWAASPRAAVWARAILTSAVVAAASFAVMTWLTGLGYGWLRALDVPGRMNSMSISSNVGALLSYLLDRADFFEASRAVKPLVRAIGSAIALGIVAWLGIKVLRNPRWALAFLAGSFMALAVFGPSLRPWYLLSVTTWLGFVPMRMAWERLMVWATAFMVVYAAMDAAAMNQAVALGAIALIVFIWQVAAGDATFVETRLRQAEAVARSGSAVQQRTDRAGEGRSQV